MSNNTVDFERGVRVPALACALLAALVLPPLAHAGQEEAPRPVPEVERVREHRLENGWRFLVLQRPGAPVLSFETHVRVGSVDELPGESGMAHLFEHLAFKGSDRIGTRDWPAERRALQRADELYVAWLKARDGGEAEATAAAREAFEEARRAAEELLVDEAYGRYFEQAGGAETLNASSSADATRFYVTLPSNQLELWCWLEAERFRRPVLRDLYRELDAVLEEQRTFVQSDPLGTLLEQLTRAAFAGHPYGRPVLGTPEGILHTTRPEARAFFERCYTPDRMTTAIVGDVDVEALIPMLDRYFGPVPARELTETVVPEVPSAQGQDRITVPFAARPLIAVAWHVPELFHRDTPAVEMAVRLLGSGRSARLERRLVQEEAVATEIGLFNGWPGDRYENLAVFYAVPASGRTTAEIEAVLGEEIERLATEGPESSELAGAVRRAQVEAWRELEQHAGMARRLAEAAAKTGDYRFAFERPGRLSAVTAEDVQRVLTTYFKTSNRIVATLVDEEER